MGTVLSLLEICSGLVGLNDGLRQVPQVLLEGGGIVETFLRGPSQSLCFAFDEEGVFSVSQKQIRRPLASFFWTLLELTDHLVS